MAGILYSYGDILDGTAVYFDSFDSIQYSPTAPTGQVTLRIVAGSADLSDEFSGGKGWTVSVLGAGSSVKMGSGADTLSGAATGVRLDGGDGEDQISSSAGQSQLLGGNGKDNLRGATTDTLWGGSGNDMILYGRLNYGGGGDDSLYSNSDGCTLFGGIGNDVLTGGAKTDNIHGGSGQDSLVGHGGSDILRGEGGNDTLWGDWANTALVGVDVLFGGDGVDSLFDRGDSGRVYGGAGEDQIQVRYAISGHVEGGTGRDVLRVQDNQTNLFIVSVSGVEVLVTGGDGVTATAVQLEGFDVITFDDRPEFALSQIRLTLHGAGYVNLTDELSGRAVAVEASDVGNTIVAGIGDDTLFGGQAADVLRGWLGNDSIYGGLTGNDRLIGDGGNDTIRSEIGLGLIGNSSLYGGNGDDLLFGGGDGGFAYGGAGNDRILSLFENMEFYGGAGDDVVEAIGNATVNGGTGWDELKLSGTESLLTMDVSGFEVLSGSYDLLASVAQLSAFRSIFVGRIQIATAGNLDLGPAYGTRNVNVATSTAGNHVSTGGGHDTLTGQSGDDMLAARLGNDWLYGEGGNDTLVGGDGNDTMEGGGGRDVFLFNIAANSVSNVDRIADFFSGTDYLAFDGAIYAGLESIGGGLLDPGQFVSGSVAADADDRLVFWRTSFLGNLLYFDADGNGPTEQVLILKLGSGVSLTATDILVL